MAEEAAHVTHLGRQLGGQHNQDVWTHISTSCGKWPCRCCALAFGCQAMLVRCVKLGVSLEDCMQPMIPEGVHALQHGGWDQKE